MSKFVMVAAIMVGTGMASAAWAEPDHAKEQGVQVTAEAMKQKLNDLGYDVHRLEVDHGRYEAHLVDRASGGGVKAHFDGRDGELLRAEPRH